MAKLMCCLSYDCVILYRTLSLTGVRGSSAGFEKQKPVGRQHDRELSGPLGPIGTPVNMHKKPEPLVTQSQGNKFSQQPGQAWKWILPQSNLRWDPSSGWHHDSKLVVLPRILTYNC